MCSNANWEEKKCSVVKIQRKTQYSPQTNRKSTQKAAAQTMTQSGFSTCNSAKQQPSTIFLMTYSRGFQPLQTPGTSKPVILPTQGTSLKKAIFSQYHSKKKKKKK